MTRMGEKYWDEIADNYDREIFDTLAGARTRVIVDHIDMCSSPKAIACDFGCGIGKYVNTLGDRFKSVYAIDISKKLLEQAKKSNRKVSNVVYLKGDLANPSVDVGPVHFALNVNVLIMASVTRRRRILDNIFRQIRNRGHLLLVVPSLESALFAHFRLVDWNMKAGVKRANPTSETLTSSNSRMFSFRTGVLNLNGVPTKHYLKEELIVLLHDVGFRISSIAKVEYLWTSEFVRPPRWMKEPYPWDWLVLCQKS
jgi:2-polyprenyl-3-methyl-5-hydroxy-6-metoxy-1,4-benzoquinol methylase